MEFKEIILRIEKENLLIKESFFTRKTIYEAVTFNNSRVFNLTLSQYKKISKTYLTEVCGEDYNGFTKRYWKVIF